MISLWKKKVRLNASETSLNGSANAMPHEKKPNAENFMKRLGYQGNNLTEFTQKLLSAIAKEKEILQGIFLLNAIENNIPRLRFLSGYACIINSAEENEFLPGEGLPGQVAKDGKILNLKSVPEGYIRIRTGLGEASPNSLIIIPVLHENILYGVIELASFHQFNDEDEAFFRSLSELIGIRMKTIMETQAKN